MKVKYFILLVLALITDISLAADINLTAAVSKSTVAVGEQFEISFTANGNIEKFGPPDFNGFQVVSGPNQSSSMTSINGSTSISIALSYDLVAGKEGEYSIGAASVVIDGKQYRSNPVKIKVVKGKPAAQNQNTQAGSANPDGTISGNANDISKRLFLRAVPSKTNVYQGEQLAVTYKLYTNVGLVYNSFDKMPDFNGFWSQEINNNNQDVQWTEETLNGSRYHVAVLKQIILFPERSGKLTVDPLEMTFVVRQAVPSNDPIEQFFGGSYKDVKYKIKSTPIGINVKPLPETGRPAGFQGAVGDFSINATIDKTNLKANDALNYSFKVTGSGNLKLLKAPEIKVPADIEKYDPKVTDNINETLNGVSGSREYTYLMIPRHEGEYQLEPLSFSYFNPNKQSYVTLAAKDFTLNVAKGAPVSDVTAFSSANKQDVKILDKDIRYIKNDVSLRASGLSFYGSLRFWLMLCIAPILFIGAFFYRQQYRENNKDLVKVKGKKANKIAIKHLNNAKKQLLDGDKKSFYEAIYKGLYGYLSDKFNIVAADLNKENIQEQLRLRKIGDNLIDQLIDTIDLCEMARYAPISGVSEQEVFDKAKSIINNIENA